MNGNFRAIWEDGKENRVAIQFMGAQRGEYVIFKRRPDASDVSRVAGIDTLDGIRRQILPTARFSGCLPEIPLRLPW